MKLLVVQSTRTAVDTLQQLLPLISVCDEQEAGGGVLPPPIASTAAVCVCVCVCYLPSFMDVSRSFDSLIVLQILPYGSHCAYLREYYSSTSTCSLCVYL